MLLMIFQRTQEKITRIKKNNFSSELTEIMKGKEEVTGQKKSEKVRYILSLKV